MQETEAIITRRRLVTKERANIYQQIVTDRREKFGSSPVSVTVVFKAGDVYKHAGRSKDKIVPSGYLILDVVGAENALEVFKTHVRERTMSANRMKRLLDFS